MASAGGNGATRRPRVLGDCSRGVSGPLLIVTGGVHGNEPSGVESLERVFAQLERKSVPLRGRCVGLAGNIASLARSASNFYYLLCKADNDWTVMQNGRASRLQPAISCCWTRGAAMNSIFQ